MAEALHLSDAMKWLKRLGEVMAFLILFVLSLILAILGASSGANTSPVAIGGCVLAFYAFNRMMTLGSKR